ncbi:cytochrome b/b6 domain-containing protein [Ferruginibacter profundus]
MKNTIFQQPHSRAIRLWHWLTAIVTALLLFTIIVSKSFLSGWHAGYVIDHAALGGGTKLNVAQINIIVDALRNTIWKWHTRFGYVLTGLLVFRILLEFFQPRKQRFIYKMKNAFTAYKSNDNKKTARHFLIVRFIYLLFYALIIVIAGTGLWLSFNNDVPPGQTPLHHTIHDVHEACFNFLLLFLLLHLVGIIKAERGQHKNIVSGMIHGGKAMDNEPGL